MISSRKKMCQNKAMPDTRELVLASTSRYRRELLRRLGVPFVCADPGVEESASAGESPQSTALRLAVAKAHAVASRHSEALVIGADQVAHCGDRCFDKPGTHERAVRQLLETSGRTVEFDTAIALLDARGGTLEHRLVPTRVTFRRLTRSQIEEYLRREQPYDCAGSAKIEGLGIALVARVESEDPTAVIGLPLIALSGLLAKAGMPVLSA